MYFLLTCQNNKPDLKERLEEGEGNNNCTKPRSSKDHIKGLCLMRRVECVHQ